MKFGSRGAGHHKPSRIHVAEVLVRHQRSGQMPKVGDPSLRSPFTDHHKQETALLILARRLKAERSSR